MQKNKVIVICGPTASGKTALSIELAKQIHGEIVSCDSMQIYQDMNIGTAKPTPEEMQGIQHYLIGYVSPEQRYSVADYKADAKKAIKEIIEKGKMPIVVGGTGLYLDSLIYEIEYQDIQLDEEYRKKLEEEVEEKGLEALYERAKQIDAIAIEKISPNDKKRILRILEIYHATGKTKTEQEIESRKKEVEYDYKVYALDWDRQTLYDRINKRVDMMIEQGLIEEVKQILDKYDTFPIKMESRRYAKRQLTWFRKNKQTIWLNAEDEIQNNIDIILKDIKDA